MNLKYFFQNFLDNILSLFRLILDTLVKWFLFLFNVKSEVDFITKETRRYLILLFGAFIVFFVFFVIITAIALSPANTVSVPNVVGLDIIDAVSSIESSKLIPSFEFVISEKDPRGTIIKQIPSPGNIVREGKSIKIYVSIGSGEFAMPDLSGKPYQEVATFLSSKGINPSIEYLQSSIEQGIVIKTYPSTGAKIKPGTPVTIYVSSGPQASFQMPNLIGFSYDKALLFIDSKNSSFKINTIPVSDPNSDGIVLDHLPHEGEFVVSETTIELTIGVFGDEETARTTKFILYKLPLSSLNLPQSESYSVKVVVEDATGKKSIEKQFNSLSIFILPLKIKGIGKISVYVNDNLVKEETL